MNAVAFKLATLNKTNKNKTLIANRLNALSFSMSQARSFVTPKKQGVRP